MLKARTDLALEDMEISYVYDIDTIIDGMEFKKCNVDNELSKKIGKEPGQYFNIDYLNYYDNSDQIINLLTKSLNGLLNCKKDIEKILVVGLGNKTITPDSLGPLVINKIEVNRHLEEIYKYEVSAICPGVMGQTGMESSEIVSAVVNKFKFDLVIVIDALACNTPKRMCNSIQFTDAGINPGAGVGNNRKKISKETLGIDVIAIGIPTVCDIKVFSDEVETSCFVTPNNIDEAMDILSNIVACSINNVLCG